MTPRERGILYLWLIYLLVSPSGDKYAGEVLLEGLFPDRERTPTEPIQRDDESDPSEDYTTTDG